MKDAFGRFILRGQILSYHNDRSITEAKAAVLFEMDGAVSVMATMKLWLSSVSPWKKPE
jgi:hypothetical protein